MALTPADLRILIKRSTNTGEVPTVAPSTDHTDGTWDALDIYKGEMFINTADDKVWYRGDAGIVQVYPSVGGITSLNGLTAATQTFAVGTTGTDFAIVSGTSTHTFNLPTASGSNRGALSSADWTTFNGKVGGSLTSGRVPYASGASTLTDTANFVYDGTKLGVGLTTPTATIHSKGSDSTSSNFALKVDNSSSAAMLYVRNDGNVGIGTATPSALLQLVKTTAATVSMLFDNTDSQGSARIRFQSDSNRYCGMWSAGSAQTDIATFYRSKSLVYTLSSDLVLTTSSNNIYFVTDNSSLSSPTTRAEMNGSGNWNFTRATGFGQAIGFTTYSAFVDVAAGTTANAQIRLTAGVAPTTPNDGDIYYVNTNDRLMFRKNTLDAEIISASAVTTESVTSDTTLTVTYNGTTYRLLAIA